jgi:hypothetical protein
MTKTLTIILPHRLANPIFPIIKPLGTTVAGLFVWNFERFNPRQSGIDKVPIAL